MRAIDFAELGIKKFTFYYVLSVLILSAFSSFIESQFFQTYNTFSLGMLSSFLIQFLILELRLIAAKQKADASILQISISILSMLLNVVAIIIFIKYYNKNLALIGFLVAFNLSIINIVIISYFLSKK